MFSSLEKGKIAVEFAAGKEIRVYWRNQLTRKITEDTVRISCTGTLTVIAVMNYLNSTQNKTINYKPKREI